MNRIPRAVYTKELRDEAVKLAVTEGVGVSEASRRLSIPLKTLANWVRAAKTGKLKDVGRHQKPLTEVEAELARVKRELAEVKMERDLPKKVRDVLREGVAVKYGVIEQMRQDYPVPPMCRVPGVSVSGYYAWRKRKPSDRTQQEPRLEAEVLAAHRRTRESSEPERLQQHLEERGVRIGVHRIRRLRRKLGLRCKQKRRFKATTNSRHDLPVAPNLLSQDFSTTAPNQAWCGDITYIATDEGWLYLAGLKDLYSGEIVGYAMSERMTKHLVMQALFRAVATRRPPAGLIHHTDRGSQYCALAYQALVSQFDMRASMSRRGTCYDNAPIESFWGTLKNELVYHQRFATREQARHAISEYIEIFYNRQRTQARLNYQSPVAFTQRFYLNQIAA
ncbi:IS3 family transposase [Burkholderia pseudomallei]|nr:IS3 family transposase [Burkholderia pseudomallei]MBF3542468.1 IS3 family transposase [Burkholderia pseudomallei]MBF3604632.1 IS3 family transposase [Burkholderia pseudomallei]